MPELVTTDLYKFWIINSVPPVILNLPWASETFDAFVAILDPQYLQDMDKEYLATTLVAMNTDWIEILGISSERLHDQIDRSSVEAGRQAEVGEGSPMTAWYEDITKPNDIAEHIASGGQGGCSNKLVVLIGSPKNVSIVRTQIRAAIDKRRDDSEES